MPVMDGLDPKQVQAAAAHLAAGQLLGMPTETVYGLAARADDAQAVAAIFSTKGRPSDHPLIVHVADVSAVHAFADHVSPQAQALMARFWPGPLTLILPRRAGVGEAAAGGQNSIGLRWPSHPVAQALLKAAAALGVAGVAAPSANRFGRVSPTTAQHVQDEFGQAMWVLDGGPCELGIESAIVDCTRPQAALLRPGVLPREALEAVLAQPLAAPDALSPRASGTLEAHYAPSAKVVLMDHEELLAAGKARAAAGQGMPPLAVYSRVVPPAMVGACHRRMPEEAAAVAHELFAVLRELDAAGVSLIWVERPPTAPEWDGVRDRLQRAAAA